MDNKDSNVIWIARDKDNSLFIYSGKPKKDLKDNRFIADVSNETIKTYTSKGTFYNNIAKLPDTMYPEVTWENSPIELTINL
jgi:hypothetical protein